MRKYLGFIGVVLLSFACASPELFTADEIVDKAIHSAGVDKLSNAEFVFDFRDKKYRATRRNGVFELQRSFYKGDTLITDILSNDGFQRRHNEVLAIVEDTMAIKYTESVNSVHYFAKLPYGLRDKAVIKTRLPDATINGKSYYKVQVTFQKEGGGVDYNDVFVYWFDQQTYDLDYMAYTFTVNGGGVRFRAVTKEHLVQGIRLVDYANYKPKSKFTELAMLDRLYENGQLIKASDINLNNISVVLY